MGPGNAGPPLVWALMGQPEREGRQQKVETKFSFCCCFVYISKRHLLSDRQASSKGTMRNSLLVELKNVSGLRTFKKQFKTVLYIKAYSGAAGRGLLY